MLERKSQTRNIDKRLDQPGLYSKTLYEKGKEDNKGTK